MPKLAANLSWLYQEVPLLQRFGAAAAHGFKAVEILLPYEAPAKDIAAELKKHKLTQALFNMPPGDWSKGERGIAALPGREAEFAQALDTALEYAKVLDCRTVHVMSGLIPATESTGTIVKAPNTSNTVCTGGGGTGVNVHSFTIPAGTTVARFALYDSDTAGTVPSVD